MNASRRRDGNDSPGCLAMQEVLWDYSRPAFAARVPE